MDETTNTTDASSQLPQDLKTQMQMRFQLLPEDLQKTITDSNYTTALFEIAKANKLTYEQLETLQMETVMAFMGMNKPDEYREFLQNEFKKTDAEMDVLIAVLNEQVFDPVKESLHKLYSTDEEVDEATGEDVSTDVENPEIAVPTPTPVAQSVYAEAPYNPAPATATPSVATSIPINTAPAMPPVTPASMPSPMQQYAADPVMPKPVVPPAPALTSTETSVLGNAGVVLGEAQNRMGDSSLEESSLPDRSALMDGIENPTPTPRPTIMANKLTMSTTLMPNKTTDYSLPKTSTPTGSPLSAPTAPVIPVVPPQKAADPYREAV